MKILVAFDGTASAVKGLRYALLNFPAAQYVLLYVERIPYVDGAYGVSPLAYDANVGKEILSVAVVICAEQGVTPITKSEMGSPADLIIKIAEDFNTELLVLGAHNKGPIERLLLGSVSEAVTRRAHCPVLIVR